MANTSITTYAPTAYHTDGDINTHKALPTAKWIGNGSGSSSYEVITQTLTKTSEPATASARDISGNLKS